jgi:hypothetical protein
VEPDISIERKTGHFYFALTRTCFAQSEEVSGVSTAVIFEWATEISLPLTLPAG